MSYPRLMRTKCTAPLGSTVFRKRPIAFAFPRQSASAGWSSQQAALTAEGRAMRLTKAKVIARVHRATDTLLHMFMAAPTICEVHPRTISGLFFIVA